MLSYWILHQGHSKQISELRQPSQFAETENYLIIDVEQILHLLNYIVYRLCCRDPEDTLQIQGTAQLCKLWWSSSGLIHNRVSKSTVCDQKLPQANKPAVSKYTFSGSMHLQGMA